MFGKFQQHYNNAKMWGKNAYHHARKFAGDVDRGMTVAKRLYSVLEPVITSIAGNGAHHNIMKAVSGYDNLKSKIADGHEQLETTYHKARKAIKV